MRHGTEMSYCATSSFAVQGFALSLCDSTNAYMINQGNAYTHTSPNLSRATGLRHCPCSDENKNAETLWAIYQGMP